MKLSPFSNSEKNSLKELFDLIISKISSDGGDFPRIIKIALFLLSLRELMMIAISKKIKILYYVYYFTMLLINFLYSLTLFHVIFHFYILQLPLFAISHKVKTI